MLPWQPVSILVDLITPFAPFLHFEEREDYLILNTQGGGELCQMTTLSPFLKICLVCFDKKNVKFKLTEKPLMSMLWLTFTVMNVLSHIINEMTY